MHRVAFYEITRNAIRQAIQEPRELSLDLVNAQQARRALDYLVGFHLSPLLWKKVRRGLSAGRVQSPALRMICEREAEIDAFVPQEYWTLEAEGEHTAQRFPLKLTEYNGKRVEQFSFVNQDSAAQVEANILAATGAGEIIRACRGTGGAPGPGAAGPAQGTGHRPQAAPPQSVAAVYHLDPAAGSRAQARVLRAAHHAARAAAYMKVWTTARARSVSSPTCVPIR